MFSRIPSSSRHLATNSWLSTYHLFSFADYFDPENMNFGVLRVFNDDRIDARNGFGDHGHRDMEIVTIVLSGELTHRDSMGNTSLIRAGDVQYMSAGTGVVHSEVNDSDEEVHLYQIWIQPNKKNLTPVYEEMSFDTIAPNTLVPIASGEVVVGAIHIQADATIYRAHIEKDKEMTYTLEADRGLFIYVEEGIVEINGVEFASGDQARIVDEKALKMKGIIATKLIAIDVKI
jgi:redox-sensitive bicupin YhaK (pirin superfamily)